MSFDPFYEARQQAAVLMRSAGIYITGEEEERIVVTDFGLGHLQREGVQYLEWLHTARVAVHLVALFPFQALPEQQHAPAAGGAGREVTLRAVAGAVYVYLPGADNMHYGSVPRYHEAFYTARHEVALNPGDTLTLSPGTPYWLQAGGDGAVVYAFSNASPDQSVVFTHPDIVDGYGVDPVDGPDAHPP